jgi:chemotaxis protein methyltransferase CheR
VTTAPTKQTVRTGPPDPELVQIRDLIYRAVGIFHPNNKLQLLEQRVGRRMKVLKVQTLREYFECLTTRPLRQAELIALLNEITIGETCFFRNQPQLDALCRVVIPAVLAAKAKAPQRRLRIWSAGCSTGEEPYTLRMSLLDQADSQLKTWVVEILATDLNQRSLTHATAALYGAHSTRRVTPACRQKYFLPFGDQLRVHPTVHGSVAFSRLNLSDNPRMKLVKDIDIIFCCNVLIYFDLDSKRRVIKQFFDTLPPHGYLFLGPSESLYGVSDDFRLVHLPGATAYVKGDLPQLEQITALATAPSTKDVLLKRLDGLRLIPTIPAVLAPLLNYLRQPLDQLDVKKLTDFLAQDESLAAQCLHMANSPLFSRRNKVESLREAVVSLGFQHVSDIAMSCGVLNLLPKDKARLDPVVFWEHSMGCALVCRELARMFKLCDPAKAYLAGLLHDIGIIVNLWILPKEFRTAFEMAKAEGIPLHEAEQRGLGFTHSDSGRLLAESWGLAPEMVEVVTHHHSPERAAENVELVALVHVADLLCRMSCLNYGYAEQRRVDLSGDAGFIHLVQRSAAMKGFDWARLTFELDSYMEEVHSLVRTIYRR